ncbi:MAG: hypothetical protein WD081_03825 [Gammaproteobacteria bacterium]
MIESSLMGLLAGGGVLAVYVVYMLYLSRVDNAVESISGEKHSHEILKGLHHIDVQLIFITVLLALILWRVW